MCELHDERRKVILRPPPERIACADMKDDERVVRPDARLRQHVLDTLRPPPRFSAISTASSDRSQRARCRAAPADPTASAPSAAASRSSGARRRGCTSSCARRSDSRCAWSAACPREPGAAGTAVQVDRDVERARAQPSRPSTMSSRQRAEAPALGDDDDSFEMRVAADDRRRQRLDEVGEVRVRGAPPQRPHQRGGEHDVADQPKANQQDSATSCQPAT